MGRAMPGNVVTVALKPEDALKVALAKELGSLSLVLRKIKDAGMAEETKVTVEGLITKTYGRDKTELSEGDPPLSFTPKLDPLNKGDAKPVQVVEARKRGSDFLMTIIEGDKTNRVRFPRDEHGNFLRDELDRSQQAPPRPEANGKNDEP
jgi:hypothetical protein